MKKTLLSLALFASTNLFAAIGTFSDIAYFVGSGANQSALLIDYNDGSGNESLAWGYRWDGAVSGAQMLVDVAAADPLLSISSGGSIADGFFINSISYDGKLLANFFGATGSESSGWAYYLAGGTAGDAPGNEITGGGNSLPVSWVASPTGAGESGFGTAGRYLANESWDAWSFGSYDDAYTHLAPPSGNVNAAPVPEASAFAFIFGTVFMAVCSVRRRL